VSETLRTGLFLRHHEQHQEPLDLLRYRLGFEIPLCQIYGLQCVEKVLSNISNKSHNPA
jgi:hypothetical protein